MHTDTIGGFDRMAFTVAELTKVRQTKGDLFEGIGTDFDTSLPQSWLDNFAKWCTDCAPDVTYPLILSTTVWEYQNGDFGRPFSRCCEVRDAYSRYVDSK